MKTIRTTIHVALVALLVALMSTFLGAAAHADGANSLAVHVAAEQERPHAYALWQLPGGGDVDATLATLAPLDDAGVAARHPDAARRLSDPVDSHGDARFTGLVDGRYYVRAALPDGSSTTASIAPFIVDLPQVAADGTLTRDVTVHPKPVVPPPPPPTGGERFLKVAKDGTPLAGAAFVVLQKSGTDSSHRVLVDGRPLTITSGPDGTMTVTGLPYGDYLLKETAAPKGYQLLQTAIPFTVDAGSLEDPLVIRIVNVPTPPGTIPKTGDISLLLSLAAGAILIGMGTHLARKPRPAAE